MDRTVLICFGAPRRTWTRSSRAPGPPIFPSSSPPNSSWLSTSRPPRRSASRSRSQCCCGRTKSSSRACWTNAANSCKPRSFARLPPANRDGGPMRLIRWAQYAPLVVAVVGTGSLPSRAVGVSHYNGSYVGTIECDQIPGYTRGPLKAAFFLKVADGQVEYERWHVRPAAAGVDFTERGTGTVSSTGEVSLTSETGGVAYQATYRGQIDGKLLRLSGVQVWQLPDKMNHQRPCTIAVSRSE